MREIKFEYIFKEKHSNKFHTRVFTLEQLEDFEMALYLLESSWEIVARRQSTDLKDKNGRDVYEGDIVLLSKHLGAEPIPTSVYWDFGLLDHLSLLPSNVIEIIGNIYENPELLTQ